MTTPKRIPRGLWFEKSRQRWRIRLYKFNTVVHLSYHATFDEAFLALQHARNERKKLNKPPENALNSLNPSSMLGALQKTNKSTLLLD